jgi:N6-L-threonylcarbamoyladenine synthase
VLGCKYFECSHQENHIRAALHSINGQVGKKFLAVHISGGTTELLSVKRNSKIGYTIDIIGGSTDISVGQFIDRTGVKMGFDFPAGAQLDKIASNSNGKITEEVKIFTKGSEISLSGPETKISKLIEKKIDKEYISLLVFECIIKGLSSMINYATKNYNINEVILVGGVASSNFIKAHLCSRIKDSTSIYFAKASHCSDNAIGSALIGAEAVFQEE